TIAPINTELRVSDKLVEITYATLQPGTYQLVINGPAVTDRVGNALGTTVITSSFTVSNVAPQITNLTVTPKTVTEGDTATLAGSFVDPGNQEIYTLLVDWGDGNQQSVNLAAGVRSFSVAHQYLDEPPPGTSNSAFPLTVTLSDSSGGSVSV